MTASESSLIKKFYTTFAVYGSSGTLACFYLTITLFFPLDYEIKFLESRKTCTATKFPLHTPLQLPFIGK